MATNTIDAELALTIVARTAELFNLHGFDQALGYADDLKEYGIDYQLLAQSVLRACIETAKAECSRNHNDVQQMVRRLIDVPVSTNTYAEAGVRG